MFDTEIIAQGVWRGLRIREIPIATRYFDEASQIGFWKSVQYGFSILRVLVRYKLHKKRILRYPLLVAAEAIELAPIGGPATMAASEAGTSGR